MKYLNLYDEFCKGMNLPSMCASFEKTPYKGQNEIVAYLKNGKKTFARTELPTDEFTGERIPMESCGMTDGEYSWISILAYYVEKYNLYYKEYMKIKQKLFPNIFEKLMSIFAYPRC